MEKRLTKKNVAEKFSIPQNTLTIWIRYKDDIISKYESGQFGVKGQKLTFGKRGSVDNAIYKWFMNARELNVPIGGHIIREKALDFAKELNILDFKASEGWLDWSFSSCTEEIKASWEQTHLPTILSR